MNETCVPPVTREKRRLLEFSLLVLGSRVIHDENFMTDATALSTCFWLAKECMDL